jgi:hypothetical protein
VERIVRCGSQCFTVSERQDIPRFFLERTDLLGATSPTWRAPVDCIGWTKVYPRSIYPVTSPVMTKNLWTLSDGVTPCAAEAFDGTFYEFYESDGIDVGVTNLGSVPDFNFDQGANCSLPKCSRDVELVFVIDEQAGIGYSTFEAIKSFVNTTIESFQLTSNGVLFGIIWTNPLSDRVPNPVTLSGSSLTTPNLQSNVVSAHIPNQVLKCFFCFFVFFSLKKKFFFVRELLILLLEERLRLKSTGLFRALEMEFLGS